MRADDDRVVGNSVEVCKDESKPHQCPEEKCEDGKNNNLCELFYDTRSRDEWDKENDGDADKTGKKVDPVFYMDKSVTVCDLPEILVCYKENTCNVVKDICVDEGVPVREKFLFGDKDSVKCSSNSDQCGSEDMMKADKVKNSELCNDPKTNQNVEESSREDSDDAKGSSKCNQEDLIVTEEVKNSSDENSKDKTGVSSENVLKESVTLKDILSMEDEQKPLSNNNSKRLEDQSPSQLQDEEERSLEATSLETELEKTEKKLSSENPETENQQLNYLLGEDDKLFPSSFGETSFCAAEAVSGHITYSGPIAFSGSLSVRSDASTTSGRSFAFPILQSEWNSSPVRMAKADKRRQKGWRQVLICCRFS